MEHIDHAEFFDLLHAMANMPREEISPEYIQRMVMLAPPRYLDVAAPIVADAMSTPTHCDDARACNTVGAVLRIRVS